MAVKSSSSRSKKSKADVQQEMETLLLENESEKSSTTAKSQVIETWRQQELLSSVKDVSMESVSKSLANLGLEITHTLTTLNEKLVGQIQLLASLRDAVALEQKELSRLHKIDVIATSLDQLIQEYTQKKQELEKDQEESNAEWDTKKLKQEFDEKEYLETLKKQRQREKEDYDYKLALERKKEVDQYEEKNRLVERKNQEKQEELQKSWQQREEVLKSREVEYAEMKSQISGFDQRLKTEIEKNRLEAVRETEQKYQQQIMVLKKDAESDKKLAELKIASLEEKVIQSTQQIVASQAELINAKKQVQDIAEKAIEGASGSRTLAHINQIAMEQAKNRSTQN